MFAREKSFYVHGFLNNQINTLNNNLIFYSDEINATTSHYVTILVNYTRCCCRAQNSMHIAGNSNTLALIIFIYKICTTYTMVASAF